MSIPTRLVCESRSMTAPRVDQVHVDPVVARSLAGAAPRSFWLDQPDAPEPADALAGDVTADLAVIGGGFTGLWTALLARERYPESDVVLIEAKTVGWVASGRNGGSAPPASRTGSAMASSVSPMRCRCLSGWGSRTCTAHAGRVAYAAGYTGLGVGASRFAAQVLLDKLHGEERRDLWLRTLDRLGLDFDS